MPPRSTLLALIVLSGCFDDGGAGRRSDSGVDDLHLDGGFSVDAGGTDTIRDAAGGFVPRPHCDRTTDCEPTDFCVTVGQPGLASCVDRVIPPLDCMPNVPQDCCADADCGGTGLCVGAIEAAGACDGTGGGILRNVCAHDACSADGECAADEVCAPDGRSEVRGCIPAACRSDDDCTEHAGGLCELLDLDCCPSGTGAAAERRPELACVYPVIGCQRDIDCASGLSCVVRDGRAECSATCP